MTPIVTNLNSESAGTDVSKKCQYTTYAYHVQPPVPKMPTIICPRPVITTQTFGL